MERLAKGIAKAERMRRTLRHQEADWVPIGDGFWGSFLERWRLELGLPASTDIYDYYDLDWFITVPNMDPHIKPFEVLSQSTEDVVVRTGFEAVIQKKLDRPMPDFLSFDTDTVEKMAAYRFDDPWDERRYLRAGDNQLAGVGDGFERNSPAWIDSVRARHPSIAVFGSVAEGYEMLWRIIGSENALLWIAMYPDEIARFVERINAFALECARAQVKAAGGMLDGMVIWGDVAYTRDMFFAPDYWRRVFKPGVKAIVDYCHSVGLPVIYHGCGNARRIFPDFIDLGLDAYNPLEAKAGLDVVALRRQYGHRMGFCGNMDVTVWANAPMDELRSTVLTKLNAAKGGGFIFQSDHSVPSNISGERYDYVIKLARQYGRYPLRLGAFDLPDIT